MTCPISARGAGFVAAGGGDGRVPQVVGQEKADVHPDRSGEIQRGMCRTWPLPVPRHLVEAGLEVLVEGLEGRAGPSNTSSDPTCIC